MRNPPAVCFGRIYEPLLCDAVAFLRVDSTYRHDLIDSAIPVGRQQDLTNH